MRCILLFAYACLASCARQPLAQELRDDCDARVCPDDPPQYIDCMPIVAHDWEPICAMSCRAFLQTDCHIQFVD